MIRILYLLIAIIASAILIWLIAIPEEVIEAGIQRAISEPLEEGLRVSINGLKKGPLFTVHMDSIRIEKDGEEIVEIKGLVSRLDSLDPLNRRLKLSLRGRIGDGGINGEVTFPVIRGTGQTGIFNITRVDLGSIPYLINRGLDGDGHLSAVIRISEEGVNIEFSVPDLEIRDPGIFALPLLETFHHVQGAITIRDERIQIESIGLEGDKGYARLKGRIMGDSMNLRLELMPYPEKLTQVEAMLISRYEVSPGYYEIPIKGGI
jgi:type II secretion system protein N